eukprot:INCI1744.1.p2 GENE.INCI1744.1~~INCI1744.1.p2  ORF type:complete len:400 (-),score=77.06 INCI1744.1:1706-2905(-)
MALLLGAATGLALHASEFVGLSWCSSNNNNNNNSSAQGPPSSLVPHHPCFKKDDTHALLFSVQLDLEQPEKYTVKWGTTPTQYVVQQHNHSVTPSKILEEDDTLLWMSGDGKGHWFDIDELAEINYWGAPFDLDKGLIDYAANPNCFWAFYRNASVASAAVGAKTTDSAGIEAGGSVGISVADVDTDSMQLVYKFTVDNVTASGTAALADSYVDVLLWTADDADSFTLIDKPTSCYQSVPRARNVSAVEEAPSSRVPAGGELRDDEAGQSRLENNCRGGDDVVAVSWPFGWPTKDNLYVVVTRDGPNKFFANRFDTKTRACEVAYTFEFETGWAGKEPEGSLTFQWMDAEHSLVVHTPQRLFFALPQGNAGLDATTIINVTGPVAPDPQSMFAMSTWPY